MIKIVKSHFQSFGNKGLQLSEKCSFKENNSVKNSEHYDDFCDSDIFINQKGHTDVQGCTYISDLRRPESFTSG